MKIDPNYPPYKIRKSLHDVKTHLQEENIQVSNALFAVLDELQDTPDDGELLTKINILTKYNKEVYNEYVTQLREYKKNTRKKDIEIVDTESVLSSNITKGHDNHEKKNGGNYIERYAHDKVLSSLLNTYYYDSSEGGFWHGFDHFYDEGGVVFADSSGDSRIFSYNEGQLIDIGKKYHGIKKCGDFYLGKQVETKKKGDTDVVIDGSETYVVLDKQGSEMRSLKGSLLQLPEYGLYKEQYQEDDEELSAYYDATMKLIVDAVPNYVYLQSYQKSRFLFINNADYKNQKKCYLLTSGEQRNDDATDIEELQQESIYIDYLNQQKNDQELSLQQQKEKEEIIKKGPQCFDLVFEGNTYFITSITDKEGKSIFSSPQGEKYEITYPSSLYGSNYKEKSIEIDEGIFIVQGINTQGSRNKKNLFINANNGIKLSSDNSLGYSISYGMNIVRHRIDGNTAEIYDCTGTMLGIQNRNDFLNNEKSYMQITNENGKKQLLFPQLLSPQQVTRDPQVFDKRLHTYDYEDKIVVIVQEGDELKQIVIAKV